VTHFLDTNVVLRHLLNDDPAQSQAARHLFERIETGDIVVWTSELVIAEVVFVLSNKRTYNLPPGRISELLLPLIDLPNLKLAGKRLHARAFSLYISLNVDYIDAYHIALMESRGSRDMFSFDHDFDMVPGLNRHEPELPG